MKNGNHLYLSMRHVIIKWSCKQRVFLGHFFTAASGRAFSTGTLDEGRSTSSQVFPDVIEELVPDSETVAMVLRGMASAAERWHDEL